jgi:hypothetical protein
MREDQMDLAGFVHDLFVFLVAVELFLIFLGVIWDF